MRIFFKINLLMLFYLVSTSSLLKADINQYQFEVKSDSSCSNFKVCKNADKLFAIADHYLPLPQFDYRVDLIVNQFGTTKDTVLQEKNNYYELSEKTGNDFFVHLDPKSVLVEANNSGGIDLIVNTHKYRTRPKYYSFDKNLNLLSENIDTVSDYVPPFHIANTIPLIRKTEQNFSTIYIQNYEKDGTLGEVVLNSFDSEASFIKQFKLTNIDTISYLKDKKLKINFIKSRIITGQYDTSGCLYVLLDVFYTEESDTDEVITSLVLKFDRELELAWVISRDSLSEIGNFEIENMYLSSDDELYLCCFIEKELGNPESSTDVKIVCVDTNNGNIINQSEILFESEWGRFAENIEFYEDSQKNIILYGFKKIYMPQVDKYFTKYYTSKLNQSFSTMWTLEDHPKELCKSSINSMIEISENYYFFLVRKGDQKSDSEFAMVVKESASGIEFIEQDKSINMRILDNVLDIEYPELENGLEFNSTIKVFDITGREIKIEPRFHSKGVSIPISEFTQGCYFVVIQNGKQIISKKLMINK